jgi:hypothetical protein
MPTIDQLSAGFNRCFETFSADDHLVSDNAFFDLLPPFWRFQLDGPTEFTDQLRSIAAGRSTSPWSARSRPRRAS